jgi:translation initiation factor 1 (eIF-1/SUI1)
MGIFSTILDKLRHHSSATPGSPQAGSTQPSSGQQQAQGASATQSAGASLQNVDIDAVLSQLASKKGGGGNYRESIVDLLKLLDLDSSLTARKELASELNVHAGADGSAEQNIALHKAVMKKVAENGGKVPDSMKH